jgi:thiol:disulfide interchange protein
LVVAASAPSLAQLNILDGRPLKPASSLAPPGLGGPESVVSIHAQFTAGAAGRPATLSVTADIAPPWHTYAITQKPVLATPTEITVAASPDYRIVGEFRPNLPPKIDRKDLGTFETHGPSVTWQAPLEIRPGVDPKNLKVTGRARLQVCDEARCLNPTSYEFTALFVPSDPATGTRLNANGVYAPGSIHTTLRGHLAPPTVAPGSTVQLVLTAEPAAGWHIYALADRDAGAVGYKPTLIAFTNTSGFQAERTACSGRAVEARSDLPGIPPQRYHAGSVIWSTAIKIPRDAKPGPYPIEGLIGYQTCNESNCDLPRAARFEGVVTVGAAGGKGTAPLAFSDAKYGEAAKVAEARPSQPDNGSMPSSQPLSLAVVILSSLVGGFLLNFMPCVLPVIGLKILSFAEQAGRSRSHVLALNIWYSLGLLSVFMVLATLASAANLGLRETNLGWGEQYGSTAFNVVMVAIVFVMALSFLDVWEIPIPGLIGSGAATEVAAREGAFGAFAKGALTTLLATPCSGPLLGAVFGYTLGEPPLITYLIFGCIGLGMASPYLLIGAYPQLIRFLPKPGAWMDTFKQMMGFVMLGTIIFFFSFMDPHYLVATFAMMVGLWAACWWIGRTSLIEPLSHKLRAWGQGATFATVVGFCAFTWLTPHESIIPWRNFSRAELARLTEEGHTVLVDFTANWCLNCKTNLAVAIETEEVRDLIEKNKVVPLLADYTDISPEIKQTLESLKSASIPVLAIFPAGKPLDEAIVMRDLVTRQQVVDALKRAGPSKVDAAGKSLTASASP